MENTERHGVLIIALIKSGIKKSPCLSVFSMFSVFKK